MCIKPWKKKKNKSMVLKPRNIQDESIFADENEVKSVKKNIAEDESIFANDIEEEVAIQMAAGTLAGSSAAAVVGATTAGAVLATEILENTETVKAEVPVTEKVDEEEAVVTENVVEETVGEETVGEETAVEETAVEETVVAENVVEETMVVETAAAEEATMEESSEADLEEEVAEQPGEDDSDKTVAAAGVAAAGVAAVVAAEIIENVETVKAEESVAEENIREEIPAEEAIAEGTDAEELSLEETVAVEEAAMEESSEEALEEEITEQPDEEESDKTVVAAGVAAAVATAVVAAEIIENVETVKAEVPVTGENISEEIPAEEAIAEETVTEELSSEETVAVEESTVEESSEEALEEEITEQSDEDDSDKVAAAVGTAGVAGAVAAAATEEAAIAEGVAAGAVAEEAVIAEGVAAGAVAEEAAIAEGVAAGETIAAETIATEEAIAAAEETQDKKGLALLFASMAAKLGTVGAIAAIIIALAGISGLAGFGIYHHFYDKDKAVAVSTDNNDNYINDEEKVENNNDLVDTEDTSEYNKGLVLTPPNKNRNKADDKAKEDEVSENDEIGEEVLPAADSEKNGSGNGKKVNDRISRLKEEADNQKTAEQQALLDWLQALLKAEIANRNKANYVANMGDESSSAGGDSKKSDKEDHHSEDPKKPPVKPEIKNKKAGIITPFSMKSDFSALHNTKAELKVDNLSTRKSEDKKDFTMMLYLCASDLESRADGGGAASYDVLNTILSGYDTDKMNVIVCAGGTKQWKTDYFGNEINGNGLGIYYINPGKLSDADRRRYREIIVSSADIYAIKATADELFNKCIEKLVVFNGSDEAGIDMGDAGILSGFMDVCCDYFPAKNYGLILNDHGGAISGGICFSELDGTESITASKLESAIASSKICKNNTEGKALDFVTFDACLMGGVEMAYNLSQYCDYMVGSTETELGSIDYEKVFGNIGKDLSAGKQSSKQFAEYFVDAARTEKTGNAQLIQSMVCIDTNQAVNAQLYIERIAGTLLQLYDSEDTKETCYNILKQARIHSLLLGGANEMNATFDVVDIGQFFTNIKKYIEEEKAHEGNQQVNSKYNAIVSDIDKLLQVSLTTDSFVNYSGRNFYNDGVAKEESIQDGGWYKLLDRDGNAIVQSTVSILFPLYNTKFNKDGKIVNNSSVEDYDNNILPNYETLVKAQVAEYYKQVSEGKVSRLYAALDTGSGKYYQSKEESNSGLYSEIFAQDTSGNKESGIFLENKTFKVGDIENEVQVLHVQAEKNYTAEQVEKHNKYQEEKADNKEVFSTPFTDFMDTVKMLEVFISRYQDDMLKPGYHYDLIYGKENVSLSNISGAHESIDIVLDEIKSAIGYQVSYIKHGAEAVSERLHDWGFLQYKVDGNPAIDLKTEYEFSGKLGGRGITDDKTYSFVFQEDDGNIKLSRVYSDDPDDFMIIEKLLADGYEYLEFDHYTVNEGRLALIDNNDIGGEDLRMSLGHDISITKTSLMNEKEYNDYTVGIVYETTPSILDDPSLPISYQAYILDNGNGNDSLKYVEYQSNIGTAVEKEAIPAGDDTGASPEKRSLSASEHGDILTLMVAETYAEKIAESSTEDSKTGDKASEGATVAKADGSGEDKAVTDTLELMVAEKPVTGNDISNAASGEESQPGGNTDNKSSEKSDKEDSGQKAEDVKDNKPTDNGVAGAEAGKDAAVGIEIPANDNSGNNGNTSGENEEANDNGEIAVVIAGSDQGKDKNVVIKDVVDITDLVNGADAEANKAENTVYEEGNNIPSQPANQPDQMPAENTTPVQTDVIPATTDILEPSQEESGTSDSDSTHEDAAPAETSGEIGSTEDGGSGDDTSGDEGTGGDETSDESSSDDSNSNESGDAGESSGSDDAGSSEGDES